MEEKKITEKKKKYKRNAQSRRRTTIKKKSNCCRQRKRLHGKLFFEFTCVYNICDMEEVLTKGQEEGVVVARNKVWMLEYADVIVMLTREKRELSKLKKRKKLTENKGFEVN